MPHPIAQEAGNIAAGADYLIDRLAQGPLEPDADTLRRYLDQSLILTRRLACLIERLSPVMGGGDVFIQEGNQA